MGKYGAYESYKDSGVEWLGDIPEHWEAVRLKHITNLIIDGAHFTPTYVNEGVPFLRVTDIVQAKNKSINLDNIKFIPEEEHKTLSLRCNPEKGDLLYSKNGTIGVPRIIDWDFEFSIFVSLCLIKIIKQKVNVDFLQYSLLGKLTETQINIGAKSNTVTNLHLDKIKEFWATLPPLEEQKAIARFLDYKTNQIDALIAKKEALLEKLDEKRTALISHAVTKGLDANVPMKDSGIEWLGEIPEHWEVMPIKRKAQVRSGVAKGRKLDKETAVQLPYLRVANVQDGHIDISDISYIEVLDNEVERFSLRAGDVLMNEGGDNDKLGRGAVWKAEIDPCLHQNHVFAVRPNDKDLSYWLSLLTLSSYAKFYFFSRAKQSTNLASISSTNIRLFPITFPPKSEQKEIAEYLDRKTAEIDRQKAKIQEAIELLKEYRTSLITNAVTGKIDVRQVEVPLTKGDLGGSNLSKL
ncbi:MAG: restriction endonuclease subunit S [Xenococcaceae cyanobacterium MO_207.B15]|nr:restriction endonuclease subunit S [Xenococcaceae cyanobacterium MO_207.B15]